MKAALITQYLSIVVLISSCVTIYNKGKLSIEKLENRNAPILKMDGIYVAKQEKHFLPLVLFSNGYFQMNFSYSENPASENNRYLNQLESDLEFFSKSK